MISLLISFAVLAAGYIIYGGVTHKIFSVDDDIRAVYDYAGLKDVFTEEAFRFIFGAAENDQED